MAGEKIEIYISDSSRIQFHSSASGITVAVLSPDQKKAGGMIIRGTATLTQPALLALKKLLEKGRS